MALVRQTRLSGQEFDGTQDAGLFDINTGRAVSRALQTRVNSVAFATSAAVSVELFRVSPEGDEVLLFSGNAASLYVQGLVLPTSDAGFYYSLQLRTAALPGDGVVTFDYDVIGTEE